MTPQLSDVTSLLIFIGICSTRVLVAFALFPPFSSRTIPAMVRGALALAVVFPVAMVNLNQPLLSEFEAVPVLQLLLREAAVGLVIGLGFGAFCAGLQTAGELIDYQTGLTFTQSLDPLHGNSTSLTAHFFERVLFAVLMVGGVMLLLVQTLYLSYELWPIGKPLASMAQAVPLLMVAEGSRLFALALLLAGPVILVLFVVDISVGFLNRAAPQLNVFNLTLSMKSLVGLFVVAMALPMIVQRVLAVMLEVAASLKQLMLR
jgi:type III secretion protein T